MFLSPISLAVNRPGRRQTLEQAVAALFAAGEQGAWYDPSAANVTWRRNLLTYTEQFDNAAWAKIGTAPTITANDAVAPDGTTTADKIQFNATSISHRLQQTMVTTGTTPITLSIYLKGTVGGEQLKIGDGWSESGIFTLTTSWVRYSVTLTGNAGSTFYMLWSHAGTPTVHAWGAQFERGTTATAYQRIVTPEITYLADVQSQPLLFQDSTGATPVTAVEQPVGLILDRRKGLVLGPELVTNGDFSNSFTGWTAGTAWSVVSGRAYLNTTGAGSILAGTFSVTTGSTYKLTFDYEHGVGSNLVRIGNVTFSIPAATGTYTAYFTAANTNALQFSTNSATAQYYIDNVTVKLLDGNHAYQTGSTARPVLRARYNLLTYSEQFDNAAWAKQNATVTLNQGTAPDGTNTIEKVVFSGGTAAYERAVYQGGQNIPSGTSITFSIYAKGENGGESLEITNRWGGGGVVTLTTTMTRYSFTFAANATSNNFYIQSPNNNTTVYIWGAQEVVGTSAGDYQRIAAATDYATTSTITGQPFRPYLLFDGTDDYLLTANVNFSANGELLATGAVQANSASGPPVAWSLGGDYNSTGKWVVQTSWRAIVRTASSSVVIDDGITETHPTANRVVTLTGSHGAVDWTVRVNSVAGTPVGTASTTMANLPLYLGYYSSPLYMSGRIYGLVVRGKLSSAGEITAVESYMAEKAQVTL